MWTANIMNDVHLNGQLLVGIQYTNGTDSFIEQTNITGTDIYQYSQTIQNKLSTLNANDALRAQLFVGPFTSIVSAPVASVITQSMLLGSAVRYLSNVIRFRDLGIILANSSIISQAQASVMAVFDPALID